MNTIFSIDKSIPAALYSTPDTELRRRSRIENFALDTSKIEKFNSFLGQLGWQHGALDGDRLATTAREVRGRAKDAQTPAWVAHEIRRGRAICRMISDASWDTQEQVEDRAHRVVDYVRGPDKLIPKDIRRVGRLDDAIVIETAWMGLMSEVSNYLDFLRIRRIEASMRGTSESVFGFNRQDWVEARLAEQALVAHKRRVLESCYLPSSGGMFRVH